MLIGKSDPMWHGWGISEFLEAIVPKRGPVVLKAETLELGEGFEVPAGAEFEFQSTECK
ncbi:MAG: hypothetical protein K2O01_07345 [Bacteroidales bacterium]|nr:hypothetical protein [Bacteroidales bacterium]